MLLAVFCEAPPDPHFLADVIDEQLPFRSISPERDGGIGLKRPVFNLTRGVFDVEEEIRMRTLPVEFCDGPGEVPAFGGVELRCKRMMRRNRGSPQEYTTDHG